MPRGPGANSGGEAGDPRGILRHAIGNDAFGNQGALGLAGAVARPVEFGAQGIAQAGGGRLMLRAVGQIDDGVWVAGQVVELNRRLVRVHPPGGRGGELPSGIKAAHFGRRRLFFHILVTLGVGQLGKTVVEIQPGAVGHRPHMVKSLVHAVAPGKGKGAARRGQALGAQPWLALPDGRHRQTHGRQQ